jgi:hypothetical protein
LGGDGELVALVCCWDASPFVASLSSAASAASTASLASPAPLAPLVSLASLLSLVSVDSLVSPVSLVSLASRIRTDLLSVDNAGGAVGSFLTTDALGPVLVLGFLPVADRVGGRRVAPRFRHAMLIIQLLKFKILTLHRTLEQNDKTVNKRHKDSA